MQPSLVNYQPSLADTLLVHHKVFVLKQTLFNVIPLVLNAIYLLKSAIVMVVFPHSELVVLTPQIQTLHVLTVV